MKESIDPSMETVEIMNDVKLYRGIRATRESVDADMRDGNLHDFEDVFAEQKESRAKRAKRGKGDGLVRCYCDWAAFSLWAGSGALGA